MDLFECSILTTKSVHVECTQLYIERGGAYEADDELLREKKNHRSCFVYYNNIMYVRFLRCDEKVQLVPNNNTVTPNDAGGGRSPRPLLFSL